MVGYSVDNHELLHVFKYDGVKCTLTGTFRTRPFFLFFLFFLLSIRSLA